MSPHIYTGEWSKNIRFIELNGQFHGGISDAVGTEMNKIDTNLENFFSLKNTTYDCDSLKGKDLTKYNLKEWCLKSPKSMYC